MLKVGEGVNKVTEEDNDIQDGSVDGVEGEILMIVDADAILNP